MDRRQPPTTERHASGARAAADLQSDQPPGARRGSRKLGRRSAAPHGPRSAAHGLADARAAGPRCRDREKRGGRSGARRRQRLGDAMFGFLRKTGRTERLIEKQRRRYYMKNNLLSLYATFRPARNPRATKYVFKIGAVVLPPADHEHVLCGSRRARPPEPRATGDKECVR